MRGGVEHLYSEILILVNRNLETPLQITITMHSIDAAVDYTWIALLETFVLEHSIRSWQPQSPMWNALYRRIKANPARKLKIITALSLEKPVGKKDLESTLRPWLIGCFAGLPDLEYVKDLRPGVCQNIDVCEVFAKTGDYSKRGRPAQLHLHQPHPYCTRYGIAGHELYDDMAQAIAKDCEKRPAPESVQQP